jgi:hypothetical protein
MPHTTDRAALPVQHEFGSSPDVLLLLDACHLEHTGLIAKGTPTTDAMQLVRDLGQVGCYEAHVRATGTLYECPTWCEATDHARRGLWDSTSGSNGPNHTTAASEVGGVGTVDVCQLGAGPVTLYLYADGELTAAEARAAAAALLNAAAALDRITT